jgi:predicted unusual protein kinase regulating ubiquinone biosynthesis (AarF/ABC1/UbiB family)/cytochrome P450
MSVTQPIQPTGTAAPIPARHHDLGLGDLGHDARATNTTAADLIVAELLTTAGFGDPYARLERMRALGRAVPSSIGLVVTGYDDCQQALRNSDLVSDANMSFAPLLGDAWRDNRALSLLANSLLFLEGPAHHRIRRMVAAAFTPAAVASWQPTIDVIAERLLHDVAARLKNGEHVDLVESLARPLPIAVMAELIGLPQDDAAHLRTLVGAIADLSVGLALTGEDLQRVHEYGVELDAYLRNALRVSPGTDNKHVIGRIALDSNTEVTEDDRVALAFILLAAGFETTAMLVANTIDLLMNNPEQWNALAVDPLLAGSVIEESLRLQAPAAFTARVSAVDTTIADQSVPAGTPISLMLSAANRDPNHFEAPAEFRANRYARTSSPNAGGDGLAASSPPLSFGSGMHHCIGSVLARAEAQAVMQRLSILCSDIAELAQVGKPQWRPSLALRGIESLVVTRFDFDRQVRSSDQREVIALTTMKVTNVVDDAKQRRRDRTALTMKVGGQFVSAKLRGAIGGKQRKKELAEQFAAESSAHAVAVMGDMKGVVMKLGQILSFVGVGMPEVAQRSLAALQSDAPPMPEGQAELVIEHTFGKTVDRLFAEWSTKPVAAASIGQVHRARLKDGREVAVKVQYPGVAAAIDADLVDQERLLKVIGRFAMRGLEAERLASELATQIRQEIDFTIEAAHQREFADRYAGHPFIRIPGIVNELSTQVVMVSEWAPGMRWHQFIDQADQTQKDQVGEIIARFIFGSTRRYRHYNADPNPGNFLIDPTGNSVTFLDFGLATHTTLEQDRLLWLLVDSLMDHKSADEIAALSVEGGYLKEGHGLDPELLKRFISLTFSFYEENPFTVRKEWFADAAKRTFTFDGEFSALRSKLSTEAEFYLRDRTYWGMVGLLAELNATADWRGINDEYRVNAPAATLLGEREAQWIRSRSTPLGRQDSIRVNTRK